MTPHPPAPALPDDPPASATWEASRKKARFPLSMEVIYGLLAILLITVIGCFYCGVVDTENMGFTHDDGVYAVAGKALATGKGFTLLHVVGQPGQIKYPFVYPAILSLVWRFNPNYPANLPALNYITIAFSLAACALTYIYLYKAQRFPGWLSLLIVAMTTAHFYFIYFFSSVMSEGPYLFFSMLTLWAAHRVIRQNEQLSEKNLWVLIVLSAITFLTRVPGITLMTAIGAWFLLNKQIKTAVWYGLGCLALGVFPWMLWVKFHTPPVNPINYPLVNAYSNYGLEFFHNLKGTDYLASLPKDFMGLIIWLWHQCFPIFPNFFKFYPQIKDMTWVQTINVINLTGGFLLLGLYLLQVIRTVAQSWRKGQNWRQAHFNPAPFSIPGLYLFFYIMMITLWNYEDQLSRFLTAVSPLIWMYYFKPWVSFIPEIGRPWPTQRIKAAAALFAVALTATLSFWLTPSSYKTVYISRNQHWVDNGRYRWLWNDYKQTFSWINRSLPQNASLAAASDVVFYLYTNRPTFYTFFASLHRKDGQFTPDSIPLLMNSMDHYHIQYLVAEPHMTARTVREPMNKVAKQLLEAFPERFKQVYHSPKGAILIYKILPKSVKQGALR